MGTTEDIRTGHSTPGLHAADAGADPSPLTNQIRADDQAVRVGEGPDTPGDQTCGESHTTPVTGDPDTRNGHRIIADQPPGAVAGHTPDPTMTGPESKALASGRDQVSGDQSGTDTQVCSAAAVDPPGPATERAAPNPRALGLADSLLALAAEILNDLEQSRVANQNRLRQLTRDVTDADGETRGFALPSNHPDVEFTEELVQTLSSAEHAAQLHLERLMRRHPLGPWVKTQRGLGDKQMARLLAAIGDPYIRPEIPRVDGTVEPERPRRMSDLRSYCGYGDAAKQVWRRGVSVRWSPAAKMRVHLVAKSCVKQLAAPCAKTERQPWAEHVDGCRCSPYRVVYDAGRARYHGAVHKRECVRCGPSGSPAPPGSPLSLAHQDACAVRLAAKEILKDLWREARRLHGGPP